MPMAPPDAPIARSVIENSLPTRSIDVASYHRTVSMLADLRPRHE
jgi:hypothetical protein